MFSDTVLWAFHESACLSLPSDHFCAPDVGDAFVVHVLDAAVCTDIVIIHQTREICQRLEFQKRRPRVREGSRAPTALGGLEVYNCKKGLVYHATVHFVRV